MPRGKFAGKGPATSKWAPHKPRGQALVLGGALLSTPANQVRAFKFLWNQGHNVVTAATTLAPAYQAYRDDKRLTFGYGHKGSVRLGNIPYYGRYFSGTPRNLRVPTFGFGLTSKKVTRKRSSRGGSATTSTSTHESAPSAKQLKRMKNRLRFRKRQPARCRKVYRGRRCKLPAGHSGRHSYV